MTLNIESAQAQIVVAGVDTHADTHVVAVVALDGRLLKTARFAADTAGYRLLLECVAGFGVIERIGVELTGAYGAGLTRFLRENGVEVVDVDTPHPYRRSKEGKDDWIDAEEAGRVRWSV